MGEPIELDAFSSPSYKLESDNSSCSKMVNLFPELLEKGPRAGKLRLKDAPGFINFTTLPDAPLRAMLAIDSGNRLFAIAGSTVFEVFADGTFSALTGAVALNNHPAIMVTNGIQLAIASGGLGYLAEGGTPGTVTPINFTDGSPLKAATITFLNNYFIAAEVDSKRVFVSGLTPDGGIWDPADVKIKEGYPDNVARVFADNQQLFVFGFDAFEPWTGTGGQFPFERTNDAVLVFPCVAPYSVAGAEGFRFWLGKGGVVYGAQGLAPQRVSDYGVELAIKSYGNVSDAEGWCQVSGGHLFYFLLFPTAKKCWVLDNSIKAWHERGLWNAGQYELYRGRVYAQAFNFDLVGDPYSGKIYRLDPNTYTDAGGGVLRRERICPYFTSSMRNLRFSQLTMDQDTGVGLDVASDQPGYDPQLVMAYSKNRGKNYFNERQASMGRIGENETRVVFNNNGSSRIGMTFKFYVTDPVPWNPNTAWLRIGGPEQGR